MKTLIRYSACILVTGIVFSSGYLLGQRHATEQASGTHQPDMSSMISDSAPMNMPTSSNHLPHRKPALLM